MLFWRIGQKKNTQNKTKSIEYLHVRDFSITRFLCIDSVSISAVTVVSFRATASIIAAITSGIVAIAFNVVLVVVAATSTVVLLENLYAKNPTVTVILVVLPRALIVLFISLTNKLNNIQTPRLEDELRNLGLSDNTTKLKNNIKNQSEQDLLDVSDQLDDVL